MQIEPITAYRHSGQIKLATPRSEISACRFRLDLVDSTTRIATVTEDAFIAIFQLDSHPAHRVWANGRSMIAPPVAPGSLHIVDLRDDFGAELRSSIDSLHVHMPRVALDDLSTEIGSTPIADLSVPEPWVTPDPLLPQFQSSLLAAMSDDDDASRLYSDQLLQIILRHIAYTYGGMRARVRSPGALAPWQVARTKDMIESHIGSDLSLNDLAAECRLSPAHFAKAFKGSTGVTPHGWLQSRRVERATEMLRRPSLSLAEIALECGFSDQSHFTRVFKRATGETPAAWRGLREPRPDDAAL